MQYADRASQGGTSSLDVPPWMTSPKFKSWLSFVKIGKSVTTHMNKRIIKPAIKYGNFAPLIKFAMAGTYSGMAYNLFKTAFRGKQDPTDFMEGFDELMYYACLLYTSPSPRD